MPWAAAACSCTHSVTQLASSGHSHRDRLMGIAVISCCVLRVTDFLRSLRNFCQMDFLFRGLGHCWHPWHPFLFCPGTLEFLWGLVSYTEGVKALMCVRVFRVAWGDLRFFSSSCPWHLLHAFLQQWKVWAQKPMLLLPIIHAMLSSNSKTWYKIWRRF